jgi:hypothetical protein
MQQCDTDNQTYSIHHFLKYRHKYWHGKVWILICSNHRSTQFCIVSEFGHWFAIELTNLGHRFKSDGHGSVLHDAATASNPNP